MTDGDKTKAAAGEANPGEIRKKSLESLARELDVPASLKVISNIYSLETELVIAGNDDLLKTVYLELHRNSEAKWKSAVAKTGDEQAKAIQELFESTRKGDFAHILAEKITQGEVFAVPPYMKTAIEALVG
jgi:putative ATP-dependent endonuclease of OLD family